MDVAEVEKITIQIVVSICMSVALAVSLFAAANYVATAIKINRLKKNETEKQTV